MIVKKIETKVWQRKKWYACRSRNSGWLMGGQEEQRDEYTRFSPTDRKCEKTKKIQRVSLSVWPFSLSSPGISSSYKNNRFENTYLEKKKKRNGQLTWSKSRRHSPMIFTDSFKSSSEMTSGGANRTLENKAKERSEIANNKAKWHKHIDVRRLRQNASALQKQTKLPCCPSFETIRFIDYHRV